MSTLGAFLAAASGPIAKRVMSSLGIGVVSFTGVSLAVDGLLSAAVTHWQGMPGDLSAYMQYLGAGQALAIICGGITGRVAFVALRRFALL